LSLLSGRGKRVASRTQGFRVGVAVFSSVVTSERFPGLSDEGKGGRSILETEQLVALPFEAKIVDEELLQLVKELLRKVGEASDVGIEMGHFGDGEKAVVPNMLSAFCLLAFDHADETGAKKTAGKDGFVHQDEDVDGIAILGEGARDETEVAGKDHSGGKNFFEREDLLVGVKGIFVATSSRSFDDDLEDVRCLLYGLQLLRIGERTLYAHRDSVTVR
jgi:hypothetical protein